MQKQISSKKSVIIACVAVVVVIVGAVILLSGRKEEAYRSIMVYELEGRAVIERVDIGTIDAAENLYLESGDRVSVQPDSMMRMKLDDDKYITAEADSVFSLEAEGDGQNSKTRIRLEQGAVTNEIQKPLSGESLYETSTPNSVMAVRGTIYRTELCDDGAGGQDMRLCCFEGTVAAKPILPDGTFGEEVLVPAGSELTILSDGTVIGPKSIDFTSLPEQAWQILSDLLESGADITGITKEELARIVEAAAQIEAEESEAADQAKAAPVSEEAEEQTAEDQNTEEQDGEDQQSDGRQAVAKGKTTDSGRKAPKQSNDTRTNQGEKEPGSAIGQKPSKPQDTPPAQSGTSDNSGNGNSDNGNSQGSGDGSGSGDHNGEKPDDNRGDKPSKPEKPEKKETYTVTYQYQGTVFATQQVQSGNKATAPVLCPAAEGAWDFDFGTKITANTTIEWKSGN